MKDIVLDSDFDLVIENGDFVVADGTVQHQALLLLSAPGEWRQTPLIGVNLRQFTLDNEIEAARGVIRKQFELDGMRVNAVDLSSGELPVIDATYA